MKTGTIRELLTSAGDLILDSVVILLFALALVVFIWGVIKYVINADNEDERQKGKKFMFWGIIALAVMLTVWGIVSIVINTVL